MSSEIKILFWIGKLIIRNYKESFLNYVKQYIIKIKNSKMNRQYQRLNTMSKNKLKYNITIMSTDPIKLEVNIMSI